MSRFNLSKKININFEFAFGLKSWWQQTAACVGAAFIRNKKKQMRVNA